MIEKVEQLLGRLREVEHLLSLPEASLDQKSYRALSQEYARLSELREAWERLSALERASEETRRMLSVEADAEMVVLLQEELRRLEIETPRVRQQVEDLLVPPDPRDHRTVIVELRAGTGGDEAALFVADCVRMYQSYADQKKWKVDVLSTAPSELGGFREYVMSLSGPQVFRLMQHEAGTHRVQRIPATETQGRIHTSAITVAVLVEPNEEEVHVEERDLRIDTFRASGAGGQHVNVTDSAVRITHIPTGTVVTCQDERSQHKNRDKAMRLLKARIAEEMQKKAHREISQLRASQVGSGDRSERIRTYNFPQNRVTDHRIGLTLYQLDRIMEGELDGLTYPLVAYFHQQKLTH